MNIFIPYPNILETVKVLDSRRLHKQCIECSQILKASSSKGAWSNHPATKMWSVKTHIVEEYIKIAEAELSFRRHGTAIPQSIMCKALLLEAELSGWLPEIFFIQHRKRLFTKDNVFYEIFHNYGVSFINYYFVDNVILRYNTENNKKEPPLESVLFSTYLL